MAAFITLCAATAVAQTARKHVIERGETLESIATRYGVTTEEIIKLNPDAAQFVYVGMELTLPEKPVETAAGDTAVPEKNFVRAFSDCVSVRGKRQSCYGWWQADTQRLCNGGGVLLRSLRASRLGILHGRLYHPLVGWLGS